MGNFLFNRYIFCPPDSRTVEDHAALAEGYTPRPIFYTIPMSAMFSGDILSCSSTLTPTPTAIFVAELKPQKLRPGAAPIIWSYGNGCDVYSMLTTAHRAAVYLQAPVYIYDWPGYGQTPGRCSEAGCIAALCAVIKNVVMRNKLVGAEQVVLVGQSLGAAVTIGAIASEGGRLTPKQVVLISPFTSVPDVATASELIKWGYGAIGGDTFATNEKIGAVRTPIKIYHGKLDMTIPYTHAVELQKLNPKVRLVLVPYADHNNVLSKIDLSELLD